MTQSSVRYQNKELENCAESGCEPTGGLGLGQFDKIENLLHELEAYQIEIETQNKSFRRTRERLDKSLERYQGLFELAPISYLVLWPNGIIIEANLTAAALLQVDRSQLIRDNLGRYVAPDYHNALLSHLHLTFKTKERHLCELEFIGGDGRLFFVQMESIVQPMGEAPIPQCLSVCTDISERRKQEQLIQRQANFDALTGLPNRMLFLDRLSYTVRLAEREHSGFALFFIDLDHFKWINDNYGHAAGDQILIETARRLQDCARENDTVARLSGDEFCMLLPRVSTSAAADFVARKVMAVMEAPFEFSEGCMIDIACSIGIALYPKDGKSPEALLNSADMALYQIKRAGRRCYAFFSNVLSDETASRRHRLSHELKEAILSKELELHYQPVIALDSGRIYGAEVLVRWNHPEYGKLLPNEFIPIAQSNGAIVELGEWVLGEVVKQICNWREQDIDLEVLWMNISARQFGNVERLNRFKTLFSQLHKGAELPRLGLEITEIDVLELSAPALLMFEHLKQQGVLLSVDDFGTGYSSLEKLLHCAIHFIKIDMSIVAKITHFEKCVKLVKTIIALSHSMQARIVAEGIESREQLDILHSLGCDFGQGFYIAKPLTVNELAKLLELQKAKDKDCGIAAGFSGCR